MKILCISDEIDPFIHTCTIKDRLKDVDIVLSAGDLPLTYYDFINSCLNKPLIFIFGNHNLSKKKAVEKKALSPFTFGEEEFRQTYQTTGSIYTENKVRKIKNLLIAGLGGSRWYNGGTHQYKEHQMFFRMLRLIPSMIFNRIFRGRYVDILLTHAPPLGIHDKDDACHKGFKTFLWFMKWFKPKYLIHGHVHIYDINTRRKTLYHNTTVINAYEHIIIELEDRKNERLRTIFSS